MRIRCAVKLVVSGVFMLADGYTLMHEHIHIDLSKVKNNADCRLDCREETVAELKKLYAKGVRNITEVTNIGMGRDVRYVASVACETGINILCATGFYKEPFLPDCIYEKSERDIAGIMIKEITEGIDGTIRFFYCEKPSFLVCFSYMDECLRRYSACRSHFHASPGSRHPCLRLPVRNVRFLRSRERLRSFPPRRWSLP